MVTRLYTDAELEKLISTPKRITNPRARWLEKPKGRPVHQQRNFEVFTGDGEDEIRFQIYQRQNLADEQDFSCGIVYLPRGAPPLTLARCNGPSHEHGDTVYRSHIHRASERAIAAGRRAESEAIETNRFESLEGALACLVEDYNVSGSDARHDVPRLI